MAMIVRKCASTFNANVSFSFVVLSISICVLYQVHKASCMISSLSPSDDSSTFWDKLANIEHHVEKRKKQNDEQELQRRHHNERELEWWFAGEGSISEDIWYKDYSSDEIPKDYDDPETGDTEDFLRHSDICPDKKTKTLSKGNCPKPPDCSKINKKRHGEAKLCINRVPLPYPNNDVFYVAAMKCIPEWENCDKCMCGEQRPKRERRTASSVCVYTGEGIDDDRVRVRCGRRNKSFRKKIKFDGNKFKAKKIKHYHRIPALIPDYYDYSYDDDISPDSSLFHNRTTNSTIPDISMKAISEDSHTDAVGTSKEEQLVFRRRLLRRRSIS